MPYQAEISRTNPSCFLFVIDQSHSMAEVWDPTAGERERLPQPIEVEGRVFTHRSTAPTKAVGVADAVNRLLQNLVLKCSKDEGVRDYYDVGVIGYGESVGPALGGALSGRDLVPISAIAETPARLEQRTKKEPDGAGGLVERTVRFPIWFDAVHQGGTPMCQALGLARQTLEAWLPSHRASFPPTVIHITDGESTDGDPMDAMQALTSLATDDGEVMLINLHISAVPDAKSVCFPDSEADLHDSYARTLYRRASHLTPAMRQTARRDHDLRVSDGAKGFVLNGDLTLIIQAMDIGTRQGGLTHGPLPL